MWELYGFYWFHRFSWLSQISVMIVSATMTSYGDVTSPLPPDNSTGSEAQVFDYIVISWICFITKGMVLFIGLVCNTLSIIVLLSSVKLRRTTTGHYLIVLMLADTCFLVGELIRWLQDNEPVLGVIYEENDTTCKLVYWLRYAAKLVSVWITVVITLERCLGVSIPERMRIYSTRTKAKMVTAGVVFPCLTLGAFPLWTVRVDLWEGKPYCLTMAGIYEAWNMAVLRVGSLLLPCPIIVILTVCILVMLRARHRPERFLRSTSVEQPQTTAMVLAVATSCVVLRVPYAIFWYLSSNSKKWGWSPIAQYYTQNTRDVFDVLATTNYASNFFLFCLWGSTFRGQLLHLVGCSPIPSPNTHRNSSARSASTPIPMEEITMREVVV